ncbi:uncharacterized protein LOC141858743 [Brevipalpus obovatus]|uniref:uncharacterized protein LOC141858743 n=1 Tax=Brevipalpus obovatus TaxID=246614 RepID=UPI003D9DB4B4
MEEDQEADQGGEKEGPKRGRKKRKTPKPVLPKRFRTTFLEKVYLVDNKPLCRPLSSTFLCEKFANYLCSHNLTDCLRMLPILASEKGIAQDALLRGSMIIVQTQISNGSVVMDHNLTSLLLMFFSSHCLKTEVLLELLTFYFMNHQFEAAQQDLVVRSARYLDHNFTHQDFIVIEHLSSAYFSILDFISWRREAYDTVSSCWRSDSDEGLEMLASQIALRMKTIINSGPGPFDLIIPPLLDLLFFKKSIEEARECLVTYKKKNPTNLNAYIYLYRFIDRFDSGSREDENLLKECAISISKYAPNDPLILDIIKSDILNLTKRVELLMEFIDYSENKNNIDAWTELSSLLKRLKEDSRALERIQNLYTWKYKPYWLSYHWNDIAKQGDIHSEEISLDEMYLLQTKSEVSSILEPTIEDS